MKKILVALSIALFLASAIACSVFDKEEASPAQLFVDKAIAFSGTKALKNGAASFTFRNKLYTYSRNKSSFEYTRIERDSTRTVIKTIYSSAGTSRYIGNKQIGLNEKQKEAYSSSLNSVMYFAFLPLWLNDPAVNKELIGEVKIKGKSYNKIKVTFAKEGGGEDFNDVFYYWFDKSDSSLDYLAYQYFTHEGGMRFREAYNSRKISGVIIQDYKNMKPKEGKTYTLDKLDKAFENGDLEELSLIELEEMSVRGN
jgi:hypothetical protein